MIDRTDRQKDLLQASVFGQVGTKLCRTLALQEQDWKPPYLIKGTNSKGHSNTWGPFCQ